MTIVQPYLQRTYGRAGKGKRLFWMNENKAIKAKTLDVVVLFFHRFLTH